MGGHATSSLLNIEQFWLKIITTVRYGYVSASFPWRITCAELNDANVGCEQNDLGKIPDHMHDESQTKTKALLIYAMSFPYFYKERHYLPAAIFTTKVSQLNPRVELRRCVPVLDA